MLSLLIYPTAKLLIVLLAGFLACKSLKRFFESQGF